MRLFQTLCAVLSLSLAASCQQTEDLTSEFRPAAYELNKILPLIEGKSLGLVVNPTSEINGTHLADTLISSGVNIKAAFAPEHGFRGEADAGQKIENGIDSKTGIPIISLYGSHKKPTSEDLAGIEVVIFDIQDVGVRFYTYISTMHYVMEACAENNIKFIVLDRPNPNGQYVDGPVLDLEYQSFVGMHEIPVVHGLTVGELAGMINGEGWLQDGIKADLEVIKMNGYNHSFEYSLPIKPSPNLPTDQAIKLYPSLCFFEPTVISIGRGTYFPFQVVGYTDSTFGEFTFTPESIPGMSTYPKHQDQICYGQDLRNTNISSELNLGYLLEAVRDLQLDSAFFTSSSFFDKLAGTDELRMAILNGDSEEDIRNSWQEDLDKYKDVRAKYLLYPDSK